MAEETDEDGWNVEVGTKARPRNLVARVDGAHLRREEERKPRGGSLKQISIQTGMRAATNFEGEGKRMRG